MRPCLKGWRTRASIAKPNSHALRSPGRQANEQRCFYCPIWTRTFRRPRFELLWREGRKKKLCSHPELRSIFAPTRFTGLKRPYDLVTIDKARGDPTQPNGNHGNPPHGIGRRGGLR